MQKLLSNPNAPWKAISVAVILLVIALTITVYPSPAAAQQSSDTFLSELTVSPKNIIGFIGRRTLYEIGVASFVTEATVAATANDSNASLAITPADSNSGTDGHQVTLRNRRNEVTITVTAEDGSTRAHTLSINRGARDAYFWRAHEDLDGLLIREINGARGIWGNENTFWVSDSDARRIFAFHTDGSPDRAKDFRTLDEANNDNPAGIWSNGEFMWVTDTRDKKLYAYHMHSKGRDSDEDFNTLDGAGNDNPSDIWSDGTTMWVADTSDDKIYAYRMSNKTRDTSKEFNTLSAAGNNRPTGIWSDGQTMWVSDIDDDQIYAYRMSDKARNSAKDIHDLVNAGNNSPHGIWADEVAMWVVDDGTNDKVFSYNMPRLSNTDLIAITGNEIPGPILARKSRYHEHELPANTEQATIGFIADNPNARTRVTSPADADENTPGHQVDIDTDRLYDSHQLTLRVQAQDGTNARHYLMVRGFSCHSGMQHPSRVAPDGRSCVVLNSAIVQVNPDYTVEYAKEQLNDRSGWYVTFQSESLGLIYAKHHPDNLSLAELKAELRSIASEPWAATASPDALASGDGDGDANSEPAQAPEPASNTPATGQPAITGTAAVGETLTASTSDIADENGMDNASFTYQWIRNDGNTDANINGATGSTYTVHNDDAGNSLKVRVSFTDDDANDEAVTSDAAAVPQPTPLTGSFDVSTVPESHNGSDAFTLQLSFNKEPDLGYVAVRDHVLTVANGEVTRAERTTPGKNIRWTITVAPDGDEHVTIVLPPTADCDAQGAVCTEHGQMLSNRSSTTINGPTQPKPQNDEEDQQPSEPPPAPTNLTGTLNADGSITLTWNAPDDDSVESYQVLRRRPQQGENSLTVYVDSTGSTATSYTDTGTAQNTRYVYRVKALNSAGLSGWSNYVRLDK